MPQRISSLDTPRHVAPPLSVPVHAATHGGEYSDSVVRGGVPKHRLLRGFSGAVGSDGPTGPWSPSTGVPDPAVPLVPRLSCEMSTCWSSGGESGESCADDG